jgi:hypothetical protein
MVRTIQDEAKEIFQDFFECHIDFITSGDKALMDAIEDLFILSEMDYNKRVLHTIKETLYTISSI